MPSFTLKITLHIFSDLLSFVKLWVVFVTHKAKCQISSNCQNYLKHNYSIFFIFLHSLNAFQRFMGRKHFSSSSFLCAITFHLVSLFFSLSLILSNGKKVLQHQQSKEFETSMRIRSFLLFSIKLSEEQSNSKSDLVKLFFFLFSTSLDEIQELSFYSWNIFTKSFAVSLKWNVSKFNLMIFNKVKFFNNFF